MITRSHEQEIHYRAALVALLSLVLFLLPDVAVAAKSYGSMPEAYGSFKSFLKNVKSFVDKVIKPPSDANWFVEALFITLFIYRLAVEIAKWVFERAGIVEVFSVVILGALVRIFMDFYNDITSAMLGWSSDVGGAIQKEMTGTADVFFAVDYIKNMVYAVSLPEISIFMSLTKVFVILICMLLIWALSIMAYFCAAWAVYGFALAKLIGYFFIPFILLERTAPLFDGWLRFLIGFLVYGIIARVNIVMVLLLLVTYLGLPLGSIKTGGSVSTLPVDGANFSELGGLIAMSIIALIALLSTGKFAMAITGSIGGFGGAAARLALGASGLASRMVPR